MQRFLQLRSTVATQGMENVPGQALRVNPYQNRLSVYLTGSHIAGRDRQMQVLVNERLITVHGKVAEPGGQAHLHDLLNQFFTATAMLDDVRHAHQLQIVLLAERHQLG